MFFKQNLQEHQSSLKKLEVIKMFGFKTKEMKTLKTIDTEDKMEEFKEK